MIFLYGDLFEETFMKQLQWGTPSFLVNSTTSPKVKIAEGEIIRECSLARNASRVEGRVGALGWGL